MATTHLSEPAAPAHGARRRPPLLQRDAALEAIAGVLAASRTGRGEALMFEGHAGLGKTRLHAAATEMARAQGIRVFRAQGSELEGTLAFGVAGQLLRSMLAALPHAERAGLLATAPVRVLALAGAGDEAPIAETSGLPISHGLFTILAGACESQPALLTLDDLHWADSASLEFLLYVLHRLDDLPVALVMSRRPDPGEPASEARERIAAHPRVRLERLTPLGAPAVGELVSTALGDRADDRVAQVCREVTAGNPFYLHELLRALGDDAAADAQQLARRVRTLAPDAVTRTLRVRIGRLGAPAAALARAVAILGDDVPLRHAAALADLPARTAVASADALAGADVLAAMEPLRFVHPLVRRAVETDIPAAERLSRHLQAARMLYDEGAEAERVAAHLLLGRAEGDPWAVAQLRAAAQTALSRSAPLSAVRYLERAREEPPRRDCRGEVLAELGAAEALAGLPSALEHLQAARDATPVPRRRAALALQLGRVLYARSQHERAAGVFNEGLAELPTAAPTAEDLTLHDELQAGFIAAASFVPRLHAESGARSERLLARARHGPRSHGQRMLLAQAATRAGLAGAPAPDVQALAAQAWDDGRLLEEEGPGGIGWELVATGLTLSGDYERCLAVADAVLASARSQSLPLAFATASYVRGLPLLGRGQVTEAMAELELARDARRYGWRQFARLAAGVYALCFTEIGDLTLAEAALVEDDGLEQARDLEDMFRMYVMAALRLAQGRADEALRWALDTGQACAWANVAVLATAPWRDVAAEAACALGQGERAVELALESLALAERTAVLPARLRALRVLGTSRGGSDGLEILRQACALGAGQPPRLEAIRAQIEFGAALRRANRRAEAREQLERAADLAHAGGALALFERARTELAATGARPRRDVLLSGPQALTASERRIADLAAGGRSNREISQALFVTPKTVEYHLRNAYRKLGIERRRELAAALGL